MICERCGNAIADNTTICPRCGTVSSYGLPKQSATQYGKFMPNDFRETPSYQQGYTPQYGPAQPHSMPPNGQPYPPYNAVPPYYPPGQQINVTIIQQAPPVSNKNDGALVAEIILSLFGIFGVGWLMAGETTAGAILLICSFFVYWPIMIFGTAFTLGAGLLCLGPMAIAAIIVNAVLLNNALSRKAQQPPIMQQQAPPMMQHQPPPYMHMPPQ